VNRPRDVADARGLLSVGANFDLVRLADSETPLSECVVSV